MIQSNIVYFAYAALGLSALLIAWWFYVCTRVRQEALDEYADRRVVKPHTIATVDEAHFVQLYVDCHTPRWALYVAATLTTAVLISPLALVLIPAGYEQIWQATGRHDWAGRGGYVFMFSIFFAIAGVWAGVGAAFARLHHSRAPEPWAHAFARARGEPIPEDHAWRRRPKWAQRAHAIIKEKRAARDAEPKNEQADEPDAHRPELLEVSDDLSDDHRPERTGRNWLHHLGEPKS
ncbi:hypothetical protein [Woodsholea maritima]|uniref:hypothetical protein n=1 Tax=Woodsholea maritima TaxID=240237 RepID=UPI0003729A5B|nr:hypothetical protein [Woodsholea maritima]